MEDFNNSKLLTNTSSSTTEERFKNKSNSIKKTRRNIYYRFYSFSCSNRKKKSRK
ncbi:MAG: hypothetical protein HC854_13945 [Flavobacterium sp.]|nr:hypothetical protein [Flavobacterium sp.]